ncbi:hypothetical protein CDAR_580861 [Caerostris darwini]|uniref:Uncharacterized protein n=1 Tax=Caerostris darwini TaxID=1538125 RepID=A0AAV4S7E8_9ARAC|nr:hypothetical protein CDAR_580861 [Caerostris darwini]
MYCWEFGNAVIAFWNTQREFTKKESFKTGVLFLDAAKAFLQSVNKQAKSALSWEQTGTHFRIYFRPPPHLPPFPPAHAPSLTVQFCTDVRERRSVFRRYHQLFKVKCRVEDLDALTTPATP